MAIRRQGTTRRNELHLRNNTQVINSRPQFVPSNRSHRLTSTERDVLARLAPHAEPKLRPSPVGIFLFVAALAQTALILAVPGSRFLFSCLLLVNLLAIGLRGWSAPR